MDDFRETAIGLTFWYGFLALLLGLLLIVLNDLDVHAACLAGADIALLFALALIVKSRALNEQSIVRGQFWRALPSDKRPHSEGARRMARSCWSGSGCIPPKARRRLRSRCACLRSQLTTAVHRPPPRVCPRRCRTATDQRLVPMNDSSTSRRCGRVRCSAT